jgi:hypothetical protein
MRTRWFPLTLVLLAGCFRPYVPDPHVVALAERPMFCTRGDDCEVKWGRVVQWISARSHWKIRNATDFLVTTEGPLATPYPAWIVQKIAQGEGRYRIQVDAWCADNPVDRMYGCTPPREVLLAEFNDFVDPPH